MHNNSCVIWTKNHPPNLNSLPAKKIRSDTFWSALVWCDTTSNNDSGESSCTVCCKGSEGLKQAKHATRKLTSWWFHIFFLKIYGRPFWEILVLWNLTSFPPCLRDRLWYGRDTGKSYVKRFLTSCSVTLAWLRSHASLGCRWRMTTHLTRARWATAARVHLPHCRARSRPCRHSKPTLAVYGPTYIAALARFPNKRLITVGKFERNVKYQLSMSSKLWFHVPSCNRNDTFLRAFVNGLSLFAYKASAVGNVARQRRYKADPAPRRLVPRSVGVSHGCGRPRRGGGGGPTWPVNHQHGRISSRCGERSVLWAAWRRPKNDKVFINRRKNEQRTTS